VPFIGNNYLSVISQVLNETPKSVREVRPELSEEFEAIVQRAMEKNRAERYANAQEMLADVNLLLDDPTHSTERAKITGPRRRLPKRANARYVVWVGGIAVIVAAIAVTVKVMMGGSPPAGTATADAGAAVAQQDAADKMAIDAQLAPDVQFVEMRIETNPRGATILMEGVEQTGVHGEKVAPMTIKVVKKEKDIAFTAQLDGYEEKVFSANPVIYDPKKTLIIPLKKAKPGYRPPVQHPGSASGSNAGSGSGRQGTAGGEYTGYPGAGGGTVPKK
jgi:hypothetical protein